MELEDLANAFETHALERPFKHTTNGDGAINHNEVRLTGWIGDLVGSTIRTKRRGRTARTVGTGVLAQPPSAGTPSMAT
jgi:hypothetical protein